MPMELNLSLCLPTDELSVPVVRHICTYALDEVGVSATCQSDIGIALTEACTNVLDHATQDGEDYEVHISIDDERCTIRVTDAGIGFDIDAAAKRPRAEVTAESGRGLELIRALVDHVKFISKPEAGVIVHLEKELEFDDEHPVRQALS
ncbi:MAG TPA: ATP-binding protein [Acidimicrobiales bacterium]|nr:ATP-binding protein [Acidimicrobiales bacterium]